MFARFRKEVEKLVGEYGQFLEVPKDGQADLALPCFRFAQKFGKSPQEIAKLMEVEAKGKAGKGGLVKDVRAVGPYLNFYMNTEMFAEMALKEIISKGKSYGSSSAGKGKTVIVEYSSPNISKPMSVGHLKNTIIGHALYNIMKSLGYHVISDNHLGDWGTHFGNLLYAYDRWGDARKVKKNPMAELLALYVRFHEEAQKTPDIEEEGRKWFKRLESGDKEAMSLWKEFYKWSMEDFARTYKRLGVRFDTTIGESFYVKTAKDIVKEALEKGIAKKDQGTVIIPMNGVPLIIQKSDESTIYASRDLATLKYRIQKHRPHRILYVVGSEQTLYFKQVFHAAQLLGYIKGDETVHISYGLVSLPAGRMSTRLGRIVFIEEFIKEATDFAEKVIGEKNPKLKNRKKIAEIVALAAVKYNDLSKQRSKDTVFDMKEAISFDGDTGPYLQYTCVRAASVLRKSKKKPAAKAARLTEDEARLVKTLSKFPSVVADAGRDYQPHYIANYLHNVSALFNEYYHRTRIIGTKEETQRLAIVVSVLTVLRNGLLLLDIQVPQKM